MTTWNEPMPKWLEDELKELGFVPAAPQDQGPRTEPEPKQERHPPIDKWWERGEECPH